MAIEEMIVNAVMNLAWILGGVAALWAFLTGFLIVRMVGLEKQLNMLTSTIEANMYRKRDVMKKQ